jgi:hypothetical protein
VNQILARIKKAYHLETDAEVAKLLGIKPSTLSMQKNRGKLDIVRIINKCSDLNKNWLLDGEGPMWREAIQQQKVQGIPIFSKIKFSENGKLLRGKSNKVSKIIADGEAPKYLKKYSTEKLVGYLVSADSMEPTIKKEDIAVVNTSDKTPRAGAVFLISFNDTVGCRRVQQNPGGIYSISSDNQAYEPFQVSIDGDHNFHLIGKVVWIVRSL